MTEDQNVLITVAELATLLRVDRKTAYAALRTGAIPGVHRFGRVYRIHLGSLLRWLAEADTGRSERPTPPASPEQSAGKAR